MEKTISFAVVGINFQTASIDVRDHTAFTDTQKMEMYGLLRQEGIEQAVILSTCNRSEIYYIYQEARQIAIAGSLYQQFFNCPRESMFTLDGKEALVYLFEVASGLRSLVLGEDQILGQVVRAEEFSRENGSGGKLISHIFRDAVTAAKKSKTACRISEHPLSVSYIGIRRLDEIYGIKGKKILVLGSGKMSGLALKYLYEKEPLVVYNANRSWKHAGELAAQFPSLIFIDFHDRYFILEDCDILISATASPHFVIRSESLAPRSKPLFCLDLASPRDIDPKLNGAGQITLHDIDYLRTVSEENSRQRKHLAEGIQKSLEAAAEETISWAASSRVDGTIQTLRERMDEVSADTCAFLERKLTLNDREKGILEKAIRSSMKRLMREPILALKQADGTTQKQYQETMEKLFCLGHPAAKCKTAKSGEENKKEDSAVENQNWDQGQ